jgi:hypothetical protein
LCTLKRLHVSSVIVLSSCLSSSQHSSHSVHMLLGPPTIRMPTDSFIFLHLIVWFTTSLLFISWFHFCDSSRFQLLSLWSLSVF